MRKDSPDDSTAVVDRIELAEGLMRSTAEHDEWVWSIHRSLLCQQAVDPAIFTITCPFDLWYADAARHPLLRDVPGLMAAADEHVRVHRTLELLGRKAGAPVDPLEYDRFLEARRGFRVRVQALEQGLWSAACRADALTGVRNRHGMLAELREEQQRSIREGNTCVLGMMDLDCFKALNDRYGHPAGDSVLRRVSALVSESLRPYDRIYRYGGEEFLICLPDTDPEQAHQIIERLRAEIARKPIRSGDRLIPVTVSFGLARLDISQPVEMSIARADEALYRAKRDGRNRVMVDGHEGGGWAFASPAS
jgi:diguanylate cyclase